MPILDTEILQRLAVDATDEENDILALELIDKKRFLIEYQDEVAEMIGMTLALDATIQGEIDVINDLLWDINNQV